MSLFKFPILPPEWSAEDAVALREYLSKPTGQKFLQNLFYLRPLVTAKAGEERAIQMNAREGYESALAQLLQMASQEGITQEVVQAHLQNAQQSKPN